MIRDLAWGTGFLHASAGKVIRLRTLKTGLRGFGRNLGHQVAWGATKTVEDTKVVGKKHTFLPIVGNLRKGKPFHLDQLSKHFDPS